MTTKPRPISPHRRPMSHATATASATVAAAAAVAASSQRYFGCICPSYCSTHQDRYRNGRRIGVDYEVNICTGKLETLNHCGKEHFMSAVAVVSIFNRSRTSATIAARQSKMTVSNGKLSVHFEVVKARFLRASFSAFVDVLMLATKTIEEFGQGMEL